MTRREFTSLGIGALPLMAFIRCGENPPPPPEISAAPARFEATRMTVHWQEYVKPGYVEFLRDTQPEIVQVGFYGADFYTLAHMPDSAKGLSGPWCRAGVFKPLRRRTGCG
jgi:hypothetical protein